MTCRNQLAALVGLIQQIEQEVPLAEDKVTIASVLVRPGSTKPNTASYLYSEPDSRQAPKWVSTLLPCCSATSSRILFRKRIDVTFDPSQLAPGRHDITVTNPAVSLQFCAMRSPLLRTLQGALAPLRTISGGSDRIRSRENSTGY